MLKRGKERQASRQYIVEGIRLVEEAWQAGMRPDLLFYSKNISSRGLEMVEDYRRQKVDVEEVLPTLMDSLAQTETPQGLLGIFPMASKPLPLKMDFLLIIDNLRDPGNLGTIFRTAVAAGVQAVVLTPGTTDPYAPKVLRAAMGAHFRLPMINLAWPEIIDLCKKHQNPPLEILMSEVDAVSSTCWETDLRQPIALVIGSEAEGVTPPARQAANQTVHIPMPGHSESLNAAVAAAILIFEVVRQRSS